MITGSIVALVTPMHPDGAMDWKALEGLLDWHVAAGTAAIGAVGTTGESATLDHAEHIEVIRHCVDYLDGRLPVIAGTGSNSTREAIDLTRAAAAAGAAACLLVTPYYNRPSQAGLFAHYEAIAAASEVPQLLYNVPSRTAVDMDNATVLRLAELEPIVGIKDATGDMTRGSELLAAVPEGFAVYSGDDETATRYMLNGAHGNVSVTANILPERIASLCAAALAGEEERAIALDAELAALNSALFVEANPMPIKYALAKVGRMGPGLRLPLTPISESSKASVDSALAGFGL